MNTAIESPSPVNAENPMGTSIERGQVSRLVFAGWVRDDEIFAHGRSDISIRIEEPLNKCFVHLIKAPNQLWDLGENTGYELNNQGVISYTLPVEPPVDQSTHSPLFPSRLRDRLNYISSLHPNWDGRGAIVISKEAIDRCYVILELMLQDPRYNDNHPFIAPMADGGIELEWDDVYGKDLMLTIPPEGSSVQYLYAPCDGSNAAEEKTGDLIEDSDIKNLFSDFLI